MKPRSKPDCWSRRSCRHLLSLDFADPAAFPHLGIPRPPSACAEKAKPLLWSARCHIQFANYCPLLFTCAGKGLRHRFGERQVDIRSELGTNVQALERWAQSCPATFGHKHLLVRGELARLEGRETEAMRYL